MWHDYRAVQPVSGLQLMVRPIVLPSTLLLMLLAVTPAAAVQLPEYFRVLTSPLTAALSGKHKCRPSQVVTPLQPLVLLAYSWPLSSSLCLAVQIGALHVCNHRSSP